MTVTNTAAFAQGMALDACVCTAAKTTYNDGTNAVLLSSAGSNGSEYTHIAAIPRATVTATQAQLYAHDGANYFLIATTLMPAYTMAQTTLAAATAFTHIDGTAITEFNPLRLQSGWKLYAAIGVALAGGVVVSAQRKDY
ncbi:conserved protein of unknown function [Magnetospirillum sp. XM-1]|uniref:hypothetical protein n=1 Tax=Magnetospirillum sp. XM-1 TaxID=1663591 RepID=UPI00073E1040|nr:hypothetical protein [Magnetospirillum sp. XM-1]CUW37697.1 conserved protein of unknown function [Magnetospirillum sp. XM-1]